MFEIFKKRDLNAYINDTFSFFKIEGKTYFKNYLILNGGLLIVMLLCSYFLGKNLFSGLLNANSEFDEFANTNFTFIGPLVLILVLVSILFSAIAYTYPVIYLQNMIDGGEKTPSNFLNQIKKNIGRIIIFILGTTFIIVPLLFIVFAISIALVFLLIGIPLIIIVAVGSVAWTTLAYYEYINNKASFFTAYGRAFDMIRANFWPTIIATLVMYMIIQVVTGIVSFIPQVYYYIELFTTIENGSSEGDIGTTFGIIMAVTVVVSTLLGFVLNNLLLINQGLIYYSSRERAENVTSYSQIDEIGKSDEN